MGSRLLRALAVSLLIMALGVVCVSATKQRGVNYKISSFINTSGTSFTLAGKPFFVTGVNNHYLTYGTDLEVKRVLDDAVTLGGNTVRIFLQPVIGSLDDSKPTIWDWKKEGESSSLAVNGTYLLYWDSKLNQMVINDGPNGLQRVDRVIAEAKRRNLKLIIALLDSWAYTGGAQQMTAWYIDEAHRPGSALEPNPVMDYRFFYSDKRTKHDYKEWLKHVLERVNHESGLQYRDDPTIMAWELMNEPIIDSDFLRQQWTAEMSSYVKSTDARHLVGAGSINKSPVEIAKDLVIPTIDYGTWHGYPIYDNVTPEQFNALIPRYCGTAAIYNKPVLLEEFGYARSNPDHVEAYRQWLDTLTGERNCAGWLVWVLVSRQQDDKIPPDEHDQFNIVNDGGPLWQVLKGEITKAAETRRFAPTSAERE
jgi:mannan endo-1,4-beta-mannosidase